MNRTLQLWAVAALFMLFVAGACLYILAQRWIDFQRLKDSSRRVNLGVVQHFSADPAEALTYEEDTVAIHSWLDSSRFAVPAGPQDPVAAVVALAKLRALAEEQAVELPAGSMGFAPKPIASPLALQQFLSDLAYAGVTRITAVTSSGPGSVPDSTSVSASLVCDSTALAALLDAVQSGSKTYVVTSMGVKAAPHLRVNPGRNLNEVPMTLEVTVTADLPAPGFVANETRASEPEAQAAIARTLLLMELPGNRGKERSNPPAAVLIEIVPELSPWKLVASTRAAGGWKVTLLNVTSNQFLTLTEGEAAGSNPIKLLSFTEKPPSARISFANGPEQEVTASQVQTGRAIARLATADGQIFEAVEGLQLTIGGRPFTCISVNLEQQRVILQDVIGIPYETPHQ